MVFTQSLFAFACFAPKGFWTAYSFWRTFIGIYMTPVFNQAWFCIYLFCYSQLLTFSFWNWHTNQGDDGPEQPSCCGNDIFGLLKKPFSVLTKILCCMCICLMPVTSPKQFISTIEKLLMHPIRLFLVPGTYILH